MARAGDALEHPVTGERIVWRQVARDTDGRLLSGNLFARPGGRPAAVHVHPFQEERFHVVRGLVRLHVAGSETLLSAGEEGVVPAGSAHTWSSVGEEEAEVRVDITPALRTEQFFETFFGLAADGKTNSRGLPNPLRLAVLMREYQDEVRLARPPAAVQRALFTPLAALGRALGYRGWYPAYSADPLPPTSPQPR